VHESKFDDVVAKLAAKAKEQKVGSGLDSGVTHGPINNKMQYDRVAELLDDAIANGAKGNWPLWIP
jgi:acyl-CoA reductase-like NAD-dependent aldehyde dehydrogenase